MNDDAFERAASREIVDEWRTGWLIHFVVYVAVQVLLVAIWWFTSDNGDAMPWFVFPLLGWGIGVAAHYVGYRSRSQRFRAAPR